MLLPVIPSSRIRMANGGTTKKLAVKQPVFSDKICHYKTALFENTSRQYYASIKQRHKSALDLPFITIITSKKTMKLFKSNDSRDKNIGQEYRVFLPLLTLLSKTSANYLNKHLK